MVVQSSDKNKCWIELKQTKRQQFKTIPALTDSLGNITILIKDKKIIVQKTAFLPLLQNTLMDPKIPACIAYTIITKELVLKVFITQSIQKISGLNKINFRILKLI